MPRPVETFGGEKLNASVASPVESSVTQGNESSEGYEERIEMYDLAEYKNIFGLKDADIKILGQIVPIETILDTEIRIRFFSDPKSTIEGSYDPHKDLISINEGRGTPFSRSQIALEELLHKFALRRWPPGSLEVNTLRQAIPAKKGDFVREESYASGDLPRRVHESVVDMLLLRKGADQSVGALAMITKKQLHTLGTSLDSGAYALTNDFYLEAINRAIDKLGGDSSKVATYASYARRNKPLYIASKKGGEKISEDRMQEIEGKCYKYLQELIDELVGVAGSSQRGHCQRELSISCDQLSADLIAALDASKKVG